MFRTIQPQNLRLGMLLLLAACVSPGWADVINQFGGTYSNWPTAWTALPGTNDAYDGLSKPWLDFVGDAADPGGYWASDSSYIYFRVRVAADTVTSGTFSDTVMVLIDVPALNSQNPNHADYGFAWDSKSGDNTRHGLEMMIPAVNGQQWSQNRMDDIDGSSGQKYARDINGADRTGDGYIRTTDEQATTSLGMTSFIDFAVSWDYLENSAKGNTQLSHLNYQDWSIAFASISDANDHGFLTGDISGGAGPNDSITKGWEPMNPEPVPEPVSTTLGILGLVSVALIRRKHPSKREPEETPGTAQPA